MVAAPPDDRQGPVFDKALNVSAFRVLPAVLETLQVEHPVADTTRVGVIQGFLAYRTVALTQTLRKHKNTNELKKNEF